MGSKVPSECIFRYAFKDAFLHPEDLSQFCCTGSKSHIATGLRCPYAIIGFCRLKLFFILRACYAVSWVFCMGGLESKILHLFASVVNRDALTQPQRRRGTEAIFSARTHLHNSAKSLFFPHPTPPRLQSVDAYYELI